MMFALWRVSLSNELSLQQLRGAFRWKREGEAKVASATRTVGIHVYAGMFGEIFASPWMFLFIRWNIMKPHSGQNIQWLCLWACVRLQSFRLSMEIYEEWCGDVLWNLCYELVRSWWNNNFLHRDVRVDSCCSNDGQAWLKPVFPALILQA